MRKILYIFLFLLPIQFTVFAAKPFRFALFTDLHISVSKPQHADDLKLAVKDVNVDGKIEFVLISGDDSDLGDTTSLRIAKKILSGLKMPYYITSGNHDTRQGESGSANFIYVFGTDKFSFVSNDYLFIGFPTGPEKGGNIGHITADDFNFVKSKLDKNKPTVVITHYPLLKGDLDNYKEMIGLLQRHNVIAVLNGHYHRNVLLNYNGIPGIVNRSVLCANQPAAGYSIYSVSDSLKVSERIIGKNDRVWLTLPLDIQN